VLKENQYAFGGLNLPNMEGGRSRRLFLLRRHFTIMTF